MPINPSVQPGDPQHAAHHRALAVKANALDVLTTTGRLGEDTLNATIVPSSLSWRVVTSPEWNPSGGADLTAAIQAAHDDIVATGGMGVVYIPPGAWMISATLTIDVRRVVVLGYNSALTYTPTTGIMFQFWGSTTGDAAQIGPMLAGIRLYGPGKATATTAIKMNDVSTVPLSYVAVHPLRDVRVSGFGVGILWEKRAWGNVLHSSHVEKCGVGFKVPTGLDSSMGERLGGIDTVFAECDVAVEIASGSVDAHFVHCSFDYNVVAMKSMREVWFTDCHIETSATVWDGSVGHFQHTADTAVTYFTACVFVLANITSEVFEPYNSGTLTDIYARHDNFVFDATKWTVTWGTFTSRVPGGGFPHRRLVNEVAGNRNLRRGIFRNIKSSSNPGPIFGGSLVAGRSMSGVAIPQAVQTVGGGAASTVASTLDDIAGVPLSSLTITVGASQAGTVNQNVKIQVPVSADDYGKRLFVAMRGDLTITGADSQRTVYARAFTRGDVEIGTFEAWAGYTTMPSGTTNAVDLFPSGGWAYSKIPAGTAYVSVEVQFTKIRTGDVFKLYAPLVNIV